MDLIEACKTGNLEEVKKLIAAGADVNATGSFSNKTPLMLSAMNGYVEIAQLLLAAGADVNATGSFSDKTPLILSAMKGYAEIAQLLLDAKADMEKKTFSGNTALDVACINGHGNVASLLISRGAHVNTVGRDGSTALILAVKAKNVEIVNALLDAGANINAGDKNNWTPLIWASHTKNLEMVTLLIGRGADVNAVGADGNTALKQAITAKRVKIINLLKQSGAGVEDNFEESQKLIKAVKDGEIETVKQFLAKGLDVNTRDNGSRWTPLIWACVYGNVEMVKLLLDAGADVNVIGANDSSALERIMATLETIQLDAYRHQKDPAPYLEIIKLLVHAGVDVNKSSYRFTPLIWAVKSKLPELVALFLDKGADINATDAIFGNTALICAVRGKANDKVVKGGLPGESVVIVKKALVPQGEYNDIVKLLISRGADVNAPSKYEITPLIEACSCGNTEAVKMLLDAGAAVNFSAQKPGPVNKWGPTALQVKSTVNTAGTYRA